MRDNPKLKDKSAPRKSDLYQQNKITEKHTKAGSLKDKTAIAIPEMHMVVYAPMGADPEQIREKYLKLRKMLIPDNEIIKELEVEI